MSEYYKKVYEENDPAPEGAHGWIQWKGTQVCIDLYCTCGAHLHTDEEFFYYFRCGECNQTYAVGQYVKLIPLTPELMVEGEVNLDEISTLRRLE